MRYPKHSSHPKSHLTFLSGGHGTARPDALRQGAQRCLSRLPVDAGISNTDTLLSTSKPIGYFLVAFAGVGFDHRPDDTLLSLAELVFDVLQNLGLVAMILLRVP